MVHDTHDEPHDRLVRAFERCGDGLYRFIVVRVGGDRDTADDLLQQTCYTAARKRRLPTQQDECEAWLFGVARNLIRKHWRSIRKRNGHVPLEQADRSQRLVAEMESGPLPVDVIADDEAVDQLLLALTALPADEQRLILAFYFEGRSQGEIATQLDVSPKSVESRLYRIRCRLRAMLSGEERNGK
jgi:RNA polymerase sigma-70 factor (ECF subfamily)